MKLVAYLHRHRVYDTYIWVLAYVVMEKSSHCGIEGSQHIGEKDCKQAAERRGLDFYTESDTSVIIRISDLASEVFDGHIESDHFSKARVTPSPTFGIADSFHE